MVPLYFSVPSIVAYFVPVNTSYTVFKATARSDHLSCCAACRLGDVPVTEESVVIAVSSPHRQESLAAVHFAIEALKASVPVWKKEEYQDQHQEAAWKENKECFWNNTSC